MTNIVGFAFSFGTFGAVFILIQYLQVVPGSTPLEAAVQTTPWTLAPMFVAPIAEGTRDGGRNPEDRRRYRAFSS